MRKTNSLIMRRQNSDTKIETIKNHRKRARALDLGFPNLDDIGYMDLRAKQLKGASRDDCYQAGPDKKNQTKAFLEMSRKIAKLESTKKH